MEPPWEGGKTSYINCPGHMTKIAAMLKYGKNLKKSSPEPEVLYLETWHVSFDLGLKLYKVYINDDPGLTLTYFTTRLNLGHLYV